MKRLIPGLSLFFTALLCATVYLAVRSHDGPVEDRYSERAEGYLADREREEAMGLTVVLPTRLETGSNRVSAGLSTRTGPLRGAAAAIRAMRIHGPGEDRDVRLREEEPGVYAGVLWIPSPGTWMLQFTAETGEVRTRRKWFVTAEARAQETASAAGGLHEGPVAGPAGTQEVILEVEPRPVRAMADLRFTVRLPGYEGTSPPYIDLSMPGMRMPPNRVALAKDATGAFRGNGVIVRCRSGGRAWQAAVTVPGKGAAVFSFDVAP